MTYFMHIRLMHDVKVKIIFLVSNILLRGSV